MIEAIFQPTVVSIEAQELLQTSSSSIVLTEKNGGEKSTFINSSLNVNLCRPSTFQNMQLNVLDSGV